MMEIGFTRRMFERPIRELPAAIFDYGRKPNPQTEIGLNARKKIQGKNGAQLQSVGTPLHGNSRFQAISLE